jgi:hypothetical protein
MRFASAMRIDTVQYSGVSHRKSPKVQYIFCKFFAGDVLIASREMRLASDPYNLKAMRFYEFARALYEEQKKKPGD